MVGLAFACAMEFGDSVHFNLTVEDFGKPPPPLSVGVWGENPGRPAPRAPGPWDDYEREQVQARRATKLARVARELEAQGKWAAAASEWRDYARQGTKDAEPARCRAEVLELPALDDRAIRAYLAAVDVEALEPQLGRWILAGLVGPVQTSPLKAHLAYAQASSLFDHGLRAEAAAKYVEASEAGPGPRREPSLMMAGRALLGAVPDPDDVGTEPTPSDADIRQARGILGRLLDSRFEASARGWLARADYLERRYPEALTTYLRQYRDATELDDKTRALASIRFTIGKLNGRDAQIVRGSLAKEPSLLQPYLDYRLYHHESEWPDLGPLAAFATSVLSAHPESKVSGEICARLAEIAYLEGRHDDALRFSRRALAVGGSKDDLATFVSGSALRALGRRHEALAALSGFDARYPGSYLRASAGEVRALLHEAGQDWELAAEEYKSLGYKHDFAYLVDARMSTEQVGSYARRYRSAESPDRVRFAYGLRLLRDQRFADAERALAAIPGPSRMKLAGLAVGKAAEPEVFHRLYDPLKTAQELGRLGRATKAARTPGVKAAGLLAMADYYYDRRNLLLYNPDLWSFFRSTLFGFGWNRDTANQADTFQVQRHHLDHEPAHQAYLLSLEAARAAPKGPTAPKALYRAACAARRLADYNEWWRSREPAGNMWQRAVELMTAVADRYPKDPLAKPARKYAAVFMEEGGRFRTANLFREPGDQ